VNFIIFDRKCVIINKKSEMKEFKVSNYITLKLENGKTKIYINGDMFLQCKKLILNISVNKISDFEEIESIDDASERLDSSMGNRNEELKIIMSPETEFWGHCSNLQVWYEHNYDTRFLHSNLAFPLLKELTNAGDPLAKIVFKEEIVKRLKKGYGSTFLYLLDNGYHNYFIREELIENILHPKEVKIIKEIEKITKTEYGLVESLDTLIKYGKLDKYEVHFVIRGGYIIELELMFNNTNQFPNCAKRLSNLKLLTIYISELMSLFPEPVPTLETLKELRIYNWSTLKKIPNLFYHFPNLKKIFYNGKEQMIKN